MDVGDYLLLGTDLVKDTSVLLPAYDDAQGVTARSIKMSWRASIANSAATSISISSPRCTVESGSFSHRDAPGEHGSTRREGQADRPRSPFKKGERIHTENSYKYTIASVRDTLRSTGFAVESTWTDENAWFGTHLARAV